MIRIAVAFTAFLAISPAWAQTGAAGGDTATSASPVAAADRQFVMQAASGGLAEVQLGGIAANKAANAEVKQFAQRMVQDHGKANDQLKSLAAQRNLKLPAEPDAEARDQVQKLSKLEGANFDREYMQYMVEDHERDVRKFQQEAEQGQDAGLKSFAQQTLPILQQHLELAHSTAAKVRSAKAE